MIKLSDVNFSIVQVSEKEAVPMPLLDMVNVSRRLRARTLLADLKFAYLVKIRQKNRYNKPLSHYSLYL